MHPDQHNFYNRNVHINPVFNYLARKQASSSKMLINPAMTRQLSGLPLPLPKRPPANDAFSNFIKQKFNELSQLMYQDSIKQDATSTQSNICPWQNQNTPCDTKSVDNVPVPFQSMFSKGWFFHNSCDTKCIENTPFDIQSCCFINERCIPRNTLNLNDVKKTVLNFYKTKTLSNNSHDLVSVSKHKLIRKSEDAKEDTSQVSTAKRKCTNALVLCTRSKLIRKSKAAELPALLTRSEKLLKNTKKNYIIKRHSIVRINSAENLPKLVKRKRLISRNSNTSPLVVLTKSKLIRKHSPCKEVSPLVTISRHKLRRRIKRDLPERPQGKLISINPNKLVRSNSVQKSPKEKLISINANKLVRSSLLQKSPKPEQLISINANKLVRSSLLQRGVKFSSNQSFFAKSVLYHVIRHRRLSHRGSGYVLLTRNKLIKKAKTWKKKTDVPKDRPNKMFVSLGNNKLIRKSLFTKNNELTEKKPISGLSNVKNKLLVRMLNSPSRRIQRFTNHMTRMNLKYVNSDRSRFVIRNKNNKKIIRKKRNSICPVFRRKGTCAKLLKGECFCIHDRKYVTLCKNFIGGSCNEKDCLLSHQLCPNKISICRRFLRDCCHFENCPYLHVKPALDAGICVQFLKGYCEKGKTCTSWHVYACPEYKSASKCAKGDTCRLPHLSLSYFEGKVESDEEDGNNWRYFEKNKIDDKENESISIIPERHSLGDLPDYIPI